MNTNITILILLKISLFLSVYFYTSESAKRNRKIKEIGTCTVLGSQLLGLFFLCLYLFFQYICVHTNHGVFWESLSN